LDFECDICEREHKDRDCSIQNYIKIKNFQYE